MVLLLILIRSLLNALSIEPPTLDLALVQDIERFSLCWKAATVYGEFPIIDEGSNRNFQPHTSPIFQYRSRPTLLTVFQIDEPARQ